MRLNGFSSTFRRRDLWRVSGSYESPLMIKDGSDNTFFNLVKEAVGSHCRKSFVAIVQIQKLNLSFELEMK